MRKRNLLILCLAAIMLLPACKKDTTVNDTSEKKEESKSDILITNFDLAKDLLGCRSEYAVEIMTNKGWECDDGQYFATGMYGANVSMEVEYGKTDLVYRVNIEIEYNNGKCPFNSFDYKSLVEKVVSTYSTNDSEECKFYYASYYDEESELETYNYSEFMNNIDAFTKASYSEITWSGTKYAVYLSWEQEDNEFTMVVAESSYK